MDKKVSCIGDIHGKSHGNGISQVLPQSLLVELGERQ